jgi:hypothetical protein
VNVATLGQPGMESILGYDMSDAELEAAAEETALSYTYQTSADNTCCPVDHGSAKPFV